MKKQTFKNSFLPGEERRIRPFYQQNAEMERKTQNTWISAGHRTETVAGGRF
jgi:hypothetical protein